MAGQMHRLKNLTQYLAVLAMSLIALTAGQASAQSCSVTPLNIAGVVNTYWAGTGTLSAGATSVTLGGMRTGTDSVTGLAANTTGFAVGDLMLIAQMQDADINDTSNSTAYGAGGTSSSGYTALNNAGLFHYARVTGVGASITFSPATSATFRTAARVAGTSGQRTYQIIRVPFSRTVTVTGTLRPMSWNGATGGIVAAEAGQTLTLNAGADASGLGFRGGGGYAATGDNPTGTPGADTGVVSGISYTTVADGTANSGRASKGEGVAGTPRLVDTRETGVLHATYRYTTTDSGTEGYPLDAGTGDFGRGAPANAGGGGNRHDSGGGGGGNSGSGGKGGGAYSTGADFGGFGGAAIVGYTGTRLFLGGGGGSGQGWHTPPTTGQVPTLSGGGRGGGIAILRGDTITGSATIDVRGQSGFGMPTALGGCNLPLSAGVLNGLGGEGAGAGGTAYLVASSSSLGSVIVDARGGNGGNAGHCGTNVAGPGGGGGGGLVVYYTPTTGPSSTVAGGLPGSIATTDVPPGALPGGSQPGSGTGGSLPTLPSPPAGPCADPDLTIAKTITGNIVAGQTGATYSLVVTNSGAAPKTAGNTVTVVDTLPTGLTATAITGTGWTCVLGTLTCTRTDKLDAGTSYPAITLTFNVANSAAGNATGILTNNATVALAGQTESNGANNAATTPTYVTSIFKSARITTDVDASGLANPTVGDTLTWSIFVANPAAATPVTNFQVNDALPAGVTITATGAHTITDVNATCGVVPTKNTGYNGSGSNGLIAGAQTLPANCVLRIDIPTIINFGGAKSNQATLSGTGLANVNSDAIDTTTSAATLPAGVAALANSLTQTQAAGTRDPTIVTVSYPAPTIAKSFAPAGISPGNTSVMTVTINNTGAAILTSAAFTDTYPAGLVNGTSPNGTSSCGGTVTAVAGSASLALSGATIPAAGSCTVTVNVTITGSGTYVNTLPIGALTNAQGASNTVAAAATLYTNPTVAKSFAPTAVAPNTDSTLSIAIANTNTAALTLSNPALTDSFPANLVATGGTVTISGAGCTGFAPTTITAGATSFIITAGTLPASSTCTVSFAVRSALAGTYNNTTSGVTTVTTASTGAVSNTASLGVGLISLTKFFSPNQIQSGGTSTITYTLSNPTATLQTAGTFLDTMINMTIAAPGGAAGGTCVGAAGNSFATGATSLNFTNLQIPANSSCTVTVLVTSSTVGTNPNAANGVTTALLTQGPGSNTDNLIVVGKPTIAKAFSPANINPGGTSTLTLTLTNPNTIPLTGANFTDTYPSANLQNAGPLTVGGTCAGVTTTAAAGGSTFNVTAATIPAGTSCTITVVVTSAVAAAYNNTTSGVATTQSGTAGAVSNTATLTVSTPATIAKAFGTSPIAQGGTSLITFTITNPNTTALTNLNFTDNLVNMTVANTTIGGTCAGTTNAPALVVGVAMLNLTIPTLAGSSNCTVTVSVTSNVSGTNPNTTSGVTSTQTPTAGPVSNTANLAVLLPPTHTKVFAPAQIQSGGTSTITFTITNPQATALTNVTFNDILANMTVASTTVGGTCAGETFSPVLTVGGTQINPTIPTLAASASCTITVQVTSTVPSPSGGHVNTTGPIGSTQTPSGGATASGSLLVLAPPAVSKTFTPTIVAASGRSTIIFTVTNPNSIALTNISFTDNLTETPAALLNSDAQNFIGSGRGTCIGVTPASKGAGEIDPITFTGITLAAGSSCTVYMDVFSATAGFYTNSVTNVTSTETPTATTGGSDDLTVNDRLLLTKTFTVTQAQVGQVFRMRFTISNPNSAGNNQNGLDLSDVFPAGLQVGNPTGIVTNGPCTPFVTTGITAGATTLTLTDLMTDLDNLETCYVEFNVVATTPGVKVNTVTAPPAGNPADLDNATDTATVEIFAAPSIAKAFSPATIGAGGTSTLTFTLGSVNANAVTNASFADTLTNMSVSGAQTVGGTCAGTTPSALTNGQTALSFSGITIPAGGTCTVTLTITSSTVGTLPNSTSGVTTTQTPTVGTGSGVVNLTVIGSTLTKAFSPVTIQRGTVSRLTLTITNGAGNPAQPSLTFTDTLPTNVVIANPPNTATTCTGGTVTAAAGGPTVALAGASFAAGNTSCVVGVDVTSATTGVYNNVTANISGTPTGMNTAGVSATLTVQNNATLTKAFSPLSIGAGGTSVLTFTITNGAGAGAYAGQGFIDNLPAGVSVAPAPGVVNTCGGTVTATASSTFIQLANGSIGAAPATCTVSVNVTSNSLGNYVNNSANVSGLTGGLTAAGVNATLQVVGTALTKAFSPTTIGRGAVSTMTFTITNGAGNPAQSGLGFIENLPANIFVASAPTIVNNCGGAITAVAGAGTITLAGGTLASAQASCTFSVNVTSAFVGSYFNGQARIANPSATMDTSGVNATLNVLENPAVTKSFTPSSMPLSGTSLLTITITNANNVAMTGLQATDVFPTAPAQVSLANLTTSNSCGGTLTDNAGGALNVGDVGIRVTAGSIAANSNCVITVNVTAATAGSYTNTIAIGDVQSTNAGVNSTAATAILNVLSPPAVTKAYAPNPVVAGSAATLTITITNPNAFAAITGATFTDTNPAGVLNTSVGATTCTGGSVVATVGGSTVQLLTGGVPAGGSCTVTISQSAAAAGAYANTIAIGDVTTTNAGSNTVAANATLNVYTPPTISKAFGANIGPGGNTTLAFTITNPAANPGVVSGISFIDVFPVAPAAMTLFDTNVVNTCAASVVTDSGGTALNAGDVGVQVTGISLTAGSSCTVTFNITVPSTGSYNNTSNAVAATTPLALTGGTAAATLTAVQPNLTKAFGGAAVDDGVATALVFTLTNGAGNPAQSGLGWTETLPASLRFTGASLPVAYGAGCSGPATVTATGGPPLNQIVIAGVGMSAATASCTVTIGVTGTSGVTNVSGQINGSCAGSPAAFTNTSANITGETRVTDAATSQCLMVNSRPTLTKSFGANPQTIGVGQTATLTFTIDNTAAGSIARAGLGFTDTLPGAGALTAVASTPQCGGGTVGVAGGNVITVSGASVGAGASCTITATVTGVTAGSYINGPTNSSITGVTANLNNGVVDQTLNVRQATLAKTFGGAAVDDGVATALVFTLTNGTGNPAQSGLGWTETLPASLRFTGASLPVAYSAGCTGPAAVTATGGPPLNQIVIAGVGMPAATASCTVTIGVTGTSGVTNVTGQFNASCAGSPAAFTNTSANITGETRVTDAAVSQCLVVNSRPTLTKSFGANPQTIGVGQTTTLTFTIDNTAAGNIARAGLGFTDTLPGAGALTAVASTPQCGGGTVGVAGGNVITVSGASVGAGASCTITATVTGVTAGSYINGPTNSSISGVTANLNNGVTDQTLHVRQPNLTKAFGGATIDDGVATSLVFTLTNGAGNPAQSGLGWTETLPASLRFTGASLPVAYGAGCSGPATVTATGGPPLNQIVIAGVGMSAATSSCTVTIGVSGTSGVANVAGQFNASCAGSPAAFTNTSANITGETRVTDAATSQCLVVNSRPTLTKSFGANPQTIGVGQTATLTFTIDNTAAGSIARAGLGFTDTLPGAGALAAVASTPQCGGGTVGVAGGNVITVSGASVSAGASCTITATVTGVTAGSYINGPTNSSITGVTATLNNGVTDQTLHVRQATLTKAFGGAAVDDGVATSLVFTLTNGTGNPAQSGLGWTETLPASLRFTAASLPVAYSAGCTGAATVTATGGPPLNQIVVSGISMAAATASCTVTIGVSGTSGVANVAGQFNASCAGSPAAFTNTSANITGETRVTDAATSQCLIVNSLPTITKAFGAANIGIGQTTTLAFSINNTGAGSINRTGMMFSDALPAGLVVANPPVATVGAGCAAATLTGTADASTTFGATGLNVNSGQTCVITVTVRGTTLGAKNNNTGNVTVTGMNNGVTTQTVTVVQPTLTKAFGGAAIDENVGTALVFTLTNDTGNPAQSGLGWTETLPASLRFTGASLPVAYSNGCTGPATVTATGGPPLNQIVIAGVGMPAATASCTVTIGVTGTSGVTNVSGQFNASCAGTPAAFTNTSANITGETRVTDAATSQCLVVNSLPTITKAFGAANIGIAQTTTLAFTIANTGTGNVNRTGMTFSDALPAGLVVANPPVATVGAGCAAATLIGTADASATFGATGVNVNAGQTCVITVTVRGDTLGAKNNNPGNVTVTGMNNGVTTQTVTVVQPDVAKTFGAASINDAGTTTLVFTLTNGAGNPAQGGIALGDTLPSGLRFNTTTPAVAYGAGCSGPATAAYNTGSRILSGLTGIAMTNGTVSCTVTVSGLTNEAGQTGTCAVAAQTNLAASVTATNATNISTNQCLSVALISPNVAKTFGAASINDAGTTTLVFTLTNQGTNPAQSGIALGDTLPSGLRFNTTTPAVAYGAGCSGPATAAYNTGSRILSGLTGIAMTNGTASCTVTLSGITNEPGQTGTCAVAAQTNLAANVTTTNATNISTNQCLSVATISPNVAKTFGAASINDAGTTTLVFTLTNQGTNPAQSGIALGDTLPSGLRFNTTTPAVAYGAGCSGPATAAYNTGSHVLSGLTGIAMTNGTTSCTVTISGLTNEAGQTGTCAVAAQTNLAASVTTTNATNISTDQCLSVNRINPNVAKTFGAASITDGNATTLIFTLTNQGTNPAQPSITLGDTLPSGLRFSTTTPAVAYSAGCSGPATAAYNTGSRVLSGLIGIAMSNGTASCTLTLSGLTNEPGQTGTCAVAAQTNLAANVTATNATNTSVNQCLSVTAISPTVAKSFGAALINDGVATTLIFTLVNQGSNPAQSGIALGDTLPSGLRFNTTTPSVAYGAGCSGPATAAYNTGSHVLSGLTGIAMSNGTTSCTVILSGLTNEPGQTGTCPIAAQTNLASNVTTTNATNVSTDQCLSIRSVDLTITKTHIGNFTVGSNGVYTLTVSNAATSPTTSGVITVVDTLPTGLGFVSAVGTGWACGNVGQIVTCTTSNTIAGGASASAITLTVSVTATAQPSVINIATVSGGAEPAANAGNNFANDNTLVNAGAVNQFLTNGAQTTLAGSTVFYTHTFISGMTGSVAFTTTNFTSPNNPAWTQAIYRDTDCNGTLNGAEGSALLITPVAVVPGDQVCIIVRDSVPASAPFNAQNQITVTATFNGSLIYTRQDITTVGVSGSAGLTLAKTVRNVTQGGAVGTSNLARPGDTLEYIITYSNQSAGSITNIVINDSTPSFTVNVSASCGALPPNLLPPCNITQPAVGGSGGYQWSIPTGSLAPGQSGTVVFTVTLQL